ncbi:MAG TPA: glycosyl hydrolase family 18 protein [Cellulomonas sp.]
MTLFRVLHRHALHRSPHPPTHHRGANRPELRRRAPRRRAAVLGATTASALLLASPAAVRPAAADATSAAPHVIAYYQTIYQTGSDGVRTYVGPTPLVGTATDVVVGAMHLNDDGSLHVNDIPADHPELDVMWADLAAMQDEGVRVHAFFGGAAAGTYRNLAEDFDRYYPLVRDLVLDHGLDGVDLDIEESFALSDVIHLVQALRADLGPAASITLTPVATDLAGRTTFSGGFDYAALEAAVGAQIDWYNTQFYCGWGDLASTTTFEAILANGFTADRVVVGTVTNPGNCSGWVAADVLDTTLTELATSYPSFGGVFGWEYFNALGPDGGDRVAWFAHLRAVLAAAAVPLPGQVTVGLTEVAAGAAQTLVGGGFVPGEDVAVAITDPVAVDLGTVTADADGAALLAFTVPADAGAGVWSVTATGRGGAVSTTFTVTAAGADDAVVPVDDEAIDDATDGAAARDRTGTDGSGVPATAASSTDGTAGTAGTGRTLAVTGASAVPSAATAVTLIGLGVLLSRGLLSRGR